jgi:hypothetical protein
LLPLRAAGEESRRVEWLRSLVAALLGMTKGAALLGMTKGAALLGMTKGAALLGMTKGGCAPRDDRGVRASG